MFGYHINIKYTYICT